MTDWASAGLRAIRPWPWLRWSRRFKARPAQALTTPAQGNARPWADVQFEQQAASIEEAAHPLSGPGALVLGLGG